MISIVILITTHFNDSFNCSLKQRLISTDDTFVVLFYFQYLSHRGSATRTISNFSVSELLCFNMKHVITYIQKIKLILFLNWARPTIFFNLKR